MELQAPSAPSAYKWLEDEKEIQGATAAGYTVPADKEIGKYTYKRYSKQQGCDWMVANAYTVEVMACGSITVEDPIGKKGAFTDPRDNKVYKTVKMPDGKVWFAENLNYQVGLTWNQPFNQAKEEEYISTTTGEKAIGSFWCPAVSGATLSADKNTCNVYGALYTWETAMSEDGKGEWTESDLTTEYASQVVASDPTANLKIAKGGGNRGICPEGWRIPTVLEWATIMDKIEGDGLGDNYTGQVPGGKYGIDVISKLAVKETYTGTDKGIGGWYTGTPTIASTGFDLQPAGSRSSVAGIFSGRGTNVTLLSQQWSKPRNVIVIDGSLQANTTRFLGTWRATAASVRCIQN
ncbi:MAG: hypothetical protein LBF69_04045 [Prevotellaceae bacterium]|nr:hypothetical protein [Prevotellaceae bacterium]